MASVLGGKYVMIPKLTLLLLSFSLILPAKNIGGFFKSSEEKANYTHQNENNDKARIDFANFEKINEKYGASDDEADDNQIDPEVMVHFDPVLDGGGGGTSIPNYYGFNRKQFLEKSAKYVPDNRLGTCGYISLIQLLSFYDTFYNDNIIPDQFDRSYQSATTLSGAVSYSPGVEALSSSEYPASYSPSAYRDFCFDRFSYCFHSYLTLLHNQDKGTDNNTDFTYSIGAWDYQGMLDKIYGGDKVIVSKYSSTGRSQSQFKQLIKDFIDGGDPVVVHIKDESSSNQDNWRYHSVVAYDYSGDTIYANFGWGSGSTKRSLFDSSYGYKEIYYVAALNFNKMGPKHSDNYVVNGRSYCGCCGYRTEYLNDTQDHLAADFVSHDKKVTWARPLNGTAAFVDLHVVNSSGFEILKKEHIEYNEYIFTSDEWSEMIFMAGSRLGFYVTAYGDPTYFLWWVTGYNTIKSSTTYYKNVSHTPFYNFIYTYSSSYVAPSLSTTSSGPDTTYKIQVNNAMTRTFNSTAVIVIYIVNANTGRIYLGISHSSNNRVLKAKLDVGTYYVRVTNMLVTGAVSITVS